MTPQNHLRSLLRLSCTALVVTGVSHLAVATPGDDHGHGKGKGGGELFFGLVDGAAFADSGCISIVVSKKDAVSVNLKIGAETTVLRGTIDSSTQAFILKSGKTDAHAVGFTLISGTGELTRAEGTLTVNGSTVNFTAPVLVKRPTGPNVPAKGRYTAVFTGLLGTSGGGGASTTVTEGDPAASPAEPVAGIARMFVLPNGKLKIDPKMADRSVLPLMTAIAEDGSARFWRRIGKNGALTGTLQFTSDPSATADVTGTVDWFKPARTNGRYNAQAFDTALTLEGSRYEHHGSDATLDFSAAAGAGVLTVSLSELPADITAEGTLSDKNKFTITGDDSVRLQFNRGVGLAFGSVQTGDSLKAKLEGVVLQKQNVARGLVFGRAVTGEFQLTEKPVTP